MTQYYDLFHHRSVLRMQIFVSFLLQLVHCPLSWLSVSLTFHSVSVDMHSTSLPTSVDTHKIHHKWKQTLLTHSECISKQIWLDGMYRLLHCEFWRDRIYQLFAFPHSWPCSTRSGFLFLSIYLSSPFALFLSVFSANSSCLFLVCSTQWHAVKLYECVCLCVVYNVNILCIICIFHFLSARTLN